ncbi:MAG: MFS transporter [Chloroflexi bacterium]|nr:MFS transporter [Chloroflexota bacterium]
MSSTTETLRPPAPTGYHELPRDRLIMTILGLMLTLLLSALDQTIVGTAMPRIIADLQGFDHYAWVTTAYLLSSTAVVPIVGKLSDIYGRKLFLVGGAAFFLLASMLCGLSQTLTQLIVFRGMQGIGGGILMSMVFTTISSIFPPARRGRIQGVFTSIFGFASIVGPLLGGYLTDALSWRWVFYVNLPVGLIALAVLWFGFPNIRPARTDRPIDILGAVTLVASVVPLLLALSWAGGEYAWGSPQILGLLAFAGLMTAIFLTVESRAPEPIIPLGLFKNPIISIAVASMMLVTMGMFGTILFVPLFIQGVIGASASQSGTVMMPMMLTMIVASTAAGQIISRTGRYKIVAVFGMSVAAFGMFLLSQMGPDATYTTVIRNMMIIGLGLGPTMPVFTIAAQNSVPFNLLGVVTSLTQFARSIGSTLGAALFGSLLINRFGSALNESLPASAASVIPAEQLDRIHNPQVLLNPQISASLRDGLTAAGPQAAQAYDTLIEAIRTALALSLHETFLSGSIIVALGLATVLFLREIPLRKSFGDGSGAGHTPANGRSEAPAATPMAAAAHAEPDLLV